MRVAVLGIGKMGHALARRLLESGNEVFIWNRTKRKFPQLTDAGAQTLDLPSNSWDHADYAVSFVSDDEALSSVYLGQGGLLRGAPAGATAIDMSTVSPQASSKIAAEAESAGVEYLRSPVSGNPMALSSGTLTLLVSGPRAAFERAEELLFSIGPKVLYLGASEEARIAKLAVNAILAVTSEVLAEVIVLCESNGIDRNAILDVITNSSVGSPLVAAKAKGLIERDYKPSFTSAMLLKDLNLAINVADDSKVELPATNLARDLLAKTCELGFAESDFAALLPRLQAATGRQLDVPIPQKRPGS